MSDRRHDRRNARERDSDADPITERDPEAQSSDVAEETEDQANQPDGSRAPC